GRLTPLSLSMDPNAELLLSGLEAAKNSVFESDGLYMPKLETLKTNPELGSYGSSTLFMDMFAKVITGRADLESSFENFVKEWKSRGGDDAIKEATAWYKAFHKIQ